jgi:RNA polymerase sigma-70 factor (ECF subfamily)
VAALQARDQGALLELLAAESTWTSDGGGKAFAARKQIRGGQRVARFAAGVFRKVLAEIVFRPVTVNDEPGFAVFYRDRLFSILTIETDGERILGVYSIMNPDKLRAVAVTTH